MVLSQNAMVSTHRDVVTMKVCVCKAALQFSSMWGVL